MDLQHRRGFFNVPRSGRTEGLWKVLPPGLSVNHVAQPLHVTQTHGCVNFVQVAVFRIILTLVDSTPREGHPLLQSLFLAREVVHPSHIQQEV